MSRVIMRISPDGTLRAIHTDNYDFMGLHGCGPAQRASQIEPIQSGPNAGWWYADMSPLGEEYQFCLWPPFPPTQRAAALQAEYDWLVKNWIEKDK